MAPPASPVCSLAVACVSTSAAMSGCRSPVALSQHRKPDGIWSALYSCKTCQLVTATDSSPHEYTLSVNAGTWKPAMARVCTTAAIAYLVTHPRSSHAANSESAARCTAKGPRRTPRQSLSVSHPPTAVPDSLCWSPSGGPRIDGPGSTARSRTAASSAVSPSPEPPVCRGGAGYATSARRHASRVQPLHDDGLPAPPTASPALRPIAGCSGHPKLCKSVKSRI